MFSNEMSLKTKKWDLNLNLFIHYSQGQNILEFTSIYFGGVHILISPSDFILRNWYIMSVLSERIHVFFFK
jgi:hypothetical protein